MGLVELREEMDDSKHAKKARYGRNDDHRCAGCRSSFIHLAIIETRSIR
jgi:hypothetical protein